LKIETKIGHLLAFIGTVVRILEHDLTIAPRNVRRNDAIILSGDLGRHGIAVMSARRLFHL